MVKSSMSPEFVRRSIICRLEIGRTLIRSRWSLLERWMVIGIMSSTLEQSSTLELQPFPNKFDPHFYV